VAADPAKAVEFYAKAHEGGRADGSFALAACYENGIGVEPDAEKALELYKEAANRGHEKAKDAVKRLYGKKSRKWPWQKK
jgi:hypothetical protein